MIRLRLLAVVLLAVSCNKQPEHANAAPPPQAKEARAEPLDKVKQLTFASQSEGLPATGHFAGVAMADLDGDGKAELLSGRREEEQGLFLFIFKNGKWSSQQLTDQGDYGGVALADVTGDGVPDVLAFGLTRPTSRLRNSPDPVNLRATSPVYPSDDQ